MVDIGQAIDELGIEYLGRMSGPEKAAGVARHQDWRSVGNSLVICHFANVPPGTVLELTNLATGFDYSLDELMRVGERAWNLKRAINTRLGLARTDDRLPAHVMRARSDAPSEPVELPLDDMLRAYYRARGWDELSGKPLPDTLRRLGLEEVIPELWPGSESPLEG
jgi:aldehyde:ferredoxin oxidoreductase